MALKIHGVARSRAFRTLWMAKELGLDYEHFKVDFATGETRTPAHLALNPNGHVPVIDDDGFILWESMAINLYLAKKYGRDGFYPARLIDEARAWQWSFWGMTEVEKPLLTILIDQFMTAPDKRKPEAVAEAQKSLPKPFGVLNSALQGREYLLGSTFTVADLNLASIMSWSRPIKYDFAPFPNIAAWLDRCLSRPAYKAARATK